MKLEIPYMTLEVRMGLAILAVILPFIGCCFAVATPPDDPTQHLPSTAGECRTYCSRNAMQMEHWTVDRDGWGSRRCTCGARP